MTSSLRRKPPTTAPNTPRPTAANQLTVAAITLLAAALALSPSRTLADDPPAAEEVELKSGTVVVPAAEDASPAAPASDELEFAQRTEPLTGTEAFQEPYDRDREETGLTKITTVSPFNIEPEPGIMPALVAMSPPPYTGRDWNACGFLWVAPGNCYYPLYFQDVSLERYGHTYTVAQPFVSLGKFWCDFLMLPYNMGLEHPWEHQYPLGYYRPGDCVEPRCYFPLLSWEGGVLEALVWVGGIAAIP